MVPTEPDPGGPHGCLFQHEGDGGHGSKGFCTSYISSGADLPCIFGAVSRNVSFHHLHSKYLCALPWKGIKPPERVITSSSSPTA